MSATISDSAEREGRLLLRLLTVMVGVSIGLGGWFGARVMDHMDAPAHQAAATRLSYLEEQNRLTREAIDKFEASMADHAAALAALTAVVERLEDGPGP